jgi:hypothetical protein
MRLGAARDPALATVVRVDVRIGAAVTTLQRASDWALADAALTALIGAARSVAVAAMFRIVRWDGATVADAAIVDLAVAVVVDAIPAHLSVAEQHARADLGFDGGRAQTAPVLRRRAVFDAVARDGADAGIDGEAHADQ